MIEWSKIDLGRIRTGSVREKKTAIGSDDWAVRDLPLPNPLLTELVFEIKVTYLFLLIFFLVLNLTEIVAVLLFKVIAMAIVITCNSSQEQAISSTWLRPKLF